MGHEMSNVTYNLPNAIKSSSVEDIRTYSLYHCGVKHGESEKSLVNDISHGVRAYYAKPNKLVDNRSFRDAMKRKSKRIA